MGCYARAAQAHFLLDGENPVHIVRIGRALHQFHQRRTAGAVVEGLATHQPAQLAIGGVKRAICAQRGQAFGLALGRCADVDHQRLARDGLLALRSPGMMDSLEPDHAQQLVLAQLHPQPGQYPVVDAAHIAKLEAAIAGVAGDHHAHLVHVRGQHDPGFAGARRSCRSVQGGQQAAAGALPALRAMAGPGLVGDQVAHSVNGHVVHVGLDLGQDDLAHRVFVARYAGRIG